MKVLHKYILMIFLIELQNQQVYQFVPETQTSQLKADFFFFFSCNSPDLLVDPKKGIVFIQTDT